MNFLQNMTVLFKDPQQSRSGGLAFILSIFLAAAVQAQDQPCTDTDDPGKIPGRLLDHRSSPVGGYVADYSAAEKAVSLKVLQAIETICTRHFAGNGYLAKANFGYGDGNYFSAAFLADYKYSTGFYQLACSEGKIVVAHEYGTDLKITVNPLLPANLNVHLHSAGDPGYYFKRKGSRKERSADIPLFSYIVFADKDEFEKINTGTGYTDSKPAFHDAYDAKPDVTRTWYITSPGKQVLIPVSRKEYLESLLEFYEGEKITETVYWDRLTGIDKGTLKLYEKEKEGKYKKDYNEFQQRIAGYEKEKNQKLLNYETKKTHVSGLLKTKSPEWLRSPAALNPEVMNNNYRCDDVAAYNKSGYHTFYDFYESNAGPIVYKWNPDVFNRQAAGNPVFLKVTLRYKQGDRLSEAVRDHYTNHLDFAALRKLLLK